MDYSDWPPGGIGLYLDDCRNPRTNHYFNWVVVRSYKEFTNYILQQGVPKFISFDHDMGISYPEYETAAEEEAATWLPHIQTPQGRFRSDVILEPSGLDAAKWLVNYCLDNGVKLPHCTVHSANPVGAEDIKCLLNGLQIAQGQQPNVYRTVW